MRFQNPLRPDALALGLRYNADEDYYEAFEATDEGMTGRKLGLVVDLEACALEGIAPKELALCTATVNGYVGEADEDGPVYPRLVYPDTTDDERGCAQGAALDLVDLGTGRPLWGVMDVEVSACTGAVYALRFTFLAQGNEIGDEPLPQADVEAFRADSGALRIPHRDGVIVLGMQAVDEVFAN